MDQIAAQDWLDRYLAAWMSYEPDSIAALYSSDVAWWRGDVQVARPAAFDVVTGVRP